MKPLVIAHLYPELLNLYGDGGNILCLSKRLAWRHIPCEVREVALGETPRFTDVDIVFIGGGSDREQRIVGERLLKVRSELASFVEDGGVLLAVCGGYQLLGESYRMGEERVEGLGIVDMYTDRADPRLIGNIVIESELTETPIVGYENHGGRTYLGAETIPLGKVVRGFGNDGASGVEGVRYNNLVGTYIHGPLLPKNPGVADWLLERALERAGATESLEPLDDASELAANRVMYERILAGHADD